MKKMLVAALTIVLLLSGACGKTNKNPETKFPSVTTPAMTRPAVTDTVTPSPTDEGAASTPTNTMPADKTATPTPFDKTKYTILYVTGNDVNVRSAPSVNGELLYQISANTPVKAFFEKDGWYYIEYSENNYGYMIEKYLTEVSPELPPDASKYEIMYVTGSKVNVRSQPSKDGKVIAELLLNTAVNAYYLTNNWYYISYAENSYGFISADYLKSTPTISERDTLLNYISLPLKPDDADPSGTTYEMHNYLNYKITLNKEKISQITLKIKAKDAKIGVMVDDLLAKWDVFSTQSTLAYYDLITEFEPFQGTLFDLSRSSAYASTYDERIALLENIYLMMVNYEGYIDEDADKSSVTHEEYNNKFEQLKSDLTSLRNEATSEVETDKLSHSEQAKKIVAWEIARNESLNDFFEIKWHILSELDFSKNAKSYDFYKAYDRNEIYCSYHYDFKEIVLIMRGESTWAKG